MLFGCLGHLSHSLPTTGFVSAWSLRPTVSSTCLRGLRRLGLATPQCLDKLLEAETRRLWRRVMLTFLSFGCVKVTQMFDLETLKVGPNNPHKETNGGLWLKMVELADFFFFKTTTLNFNCLHFNVLNCLNKRCQHQLRASLKQLQSFLHNDLFI